MFLVIVALNGIVDIKMVRGRILIQWEYKLGGVSLGLFCFVDTFTDEELVWHELGHTVQNLIWGPLSPFVITLPSFIRAAFWPRILKKNPKADYYSIWFERQANEFGEKLKNGEYF